MKRFLKSLKYAFSGIAKSMEEGNMKIHMSISVLVILAGVYFQISRIEWIAIFLCFGVVGSAEIMNTAIEDLCDVIKEELNLAYNKTRWPRDLAAGAVLVAAGISVLVGLWIFMPRMFHF
jgi:diacylglycerol kinase